VSSFDPALMINDYEHCLKLLKSLPDNNWGLIEEVIASEALRSIEVFNRSPHFRCPKQQKLAMTRHKKIPSFGGIFNSVVQKL